MDTASRMAQGLRWNDYAFLPALELLVESCMAGGSLNERGRRHLETWVVHHLVNRLLLDADGIDRPEAVAKPVGPAIVITGLPRTGTTLLHHLLALDPGLRTLRVWETLRPGPGGVGGTTQAELVSIAAAWLDQFYLDVPCFRPIHSVAAEDPDECDALLQNEFASTHFDDMFNAEAYADWFEVAPLRRQYASYARQLSGLRRPDDGSKPWLLKSPTHLGHLDALLEACPEAMIIHCHRRPSEAMPSYASLVLCLRQAYNDNVSAGQVGQQTLRRCATAVRRALAVRREAPDQFIDVAYLDLLRRPHASVAAIYDRLGRRFSAGFAASIDNWVASHPQHRHGVHHYRGEDFDLDASVLSDNFRDYIDQVPVDLG